jgi:choline dehydrogenase-like flavoprotein
MLIDFRESPEAAQVETDVCIAGAGAAGIPLARRLMEQGHSVCLLEGGGLQFDQDTQALFVGANLGMDYYDLVDARLRFFGGTTRIWGGRCALMDRIDFERRAWVPYSGWPIDRQDLEPYYRQAHEQFELDEFNYGQELWAALGTETPSFDPARITTSLWRFDELSERYGPDRCRDLMDSDRVRILLHANVVQIQASDNARRVEHLVVKALDGQTCQVRARQYVLAAGAIENARLLLASSDIERSGLGNARDQVGRYFMEHPNGRIARVDVQRPFELWRSLQKRFMPSGPPLAPVLRLAEETQREKQALNSAVTFKLQRDPSRGLSLVQGIYPTIKHAMNPNRTGLALNHAYRSIRAWIHREVRMTVEATRTRLGLRQLYLIMRGEQVPNPDSRVTLSHDTDALGTHQADLHWQLSPEDKRTAGVFIETLGAELSRLGLGRLEPMDWVDSQDVHWPVDPTVGNHHIGGYHHMGTTRMSADPATGVVDGDCRVHGYANLFVAGSSVFSTSGWANPTLTLVALALRLADHLDQQLN